jgi:N-acyl-D-amino-acid deacylase
MMKAGRRVIRNATLFDGTGSPPRAADVTIAGERIVDVGRAPGTPGPGDVDARGLALAPGFIDVHTHDDFAVVVHPEMGFKVQGGVTSVVVGNCGFGAAPWPVAQGMARTLHPGRAVPAWDGFADYLSYLDGTPASCNVAALVGHGTVRASVMGATRRGPDASELERMCELVREGMDAGCFGLSTGLIYEPGRYATTDEIVALARDVRGAGGLYATHMRDEGVGLLDSVREAIEIGQRARVPIQISHHKASGREAWGLVADSLRLIEAARERGVDVTADQYPYTAGSTLLSVVVPDGEATGLDRAEPETVTVASAPGHPEWEGKTLAELAAESGQPALDVARRIVDATGNAAMAIFHSMSEDDIIAVLRHPSTMIGSDGLPTLEGKPHPRLYGTFARVLGHYARELGVLSMAEAVHRMTGFPARKFGIVDRGLVRPGAFADLVLFDPARIADVGTYADPHHPPAGIVGVLVNGEDVVRDGAHTGARPGRALRRR